MLRLGFRLSAMVWKGLGGSSERAAAVGEQSSALGHCSRAASIFNNQRSRLERALALSCALLLAIAGTFKVSAEPVPVAPMAGDAAGFERFLDALMMAESGGKALAKNPRSTALGPFQFIDATFLDIVRRHFATEIANLAPANVLALRTDPAFARRAAAAFARDNADYLIRGQLTATFGNLRLAHLLGPAGAVRVLRAPPQSFVALWVGPTVIAANPFMAGMRVAELITRCEREIATPGNVAGRADREKKTAAKPRIQVACDLSLASCRRWRALAERRMAGNRR